MHPFLSLARHPEVYEYYEQVIVTHTSPQLMLSACPEELEAHGVQCIKASLEKNPRAGVFSGRITDNIRSGVLFNQLGLDMTEFDKSRDRIMICGDQSFNNEIRDMLEEKGWMHGTMRSPGDFVQERAFVETI